MKLMCSLLFLISSLAYAGLYEDYSEDMGLFYNAVDPSGGGRVVPLHLFADDFDGFIGDSESIILFNSFTGSDDDGVRMPLDEGEKSSIDSKLNEALVYSDGQWFVIPSGQFIDNSADRLESKMTSGTFGGVPP